MRTAGVGGPCHDRERAHRLARTPPPRRAPGLARGWTAGRSPAGRHRGGCARRCRRAALSGHRQRGGPRHLLRHGHLPGVRDDDRRCAGSGVHDLRPRRHRGRDPPRRDGPVAAATRAALEPVLLAPELLVVGAGPAGLSAAAAAAEAGVGVVVVDERAKLGGQFYKQPSEGSEVDETRAGPASTAAAASLIRRVQASGVRAAAPACRCGRRQGRAELLALGAGRAYALRPERLVLASGAYERGVPLPGWTLPGFLTTGAAQTLMRAYQVLPGAPGARLGERTAQHPGRGRDRPRAAARSSPSASSRRFRERRSRPRRWRRWPPRRRPWRRRERATSRGWHERGCRCWPAMRSCAPRARGRSSRPW